MWLVLEWRDWMWYKYHTGNWQRGQTKHKVIRVTACIIIIILLLFRIYRIAQKFRWIKISLNAHTLYWHKNFAEFNFAHSAGCSPGSSGWSSRINTPRTGVYTVRMILGTIDLSLLCFLGLSLLHTVHSSIGLCDGGRL